jgi:hypothetical protein
VRWLLLVVAFRASVAHAEPDCSGFGGAIHGSSTCVAYDLRAKRVVASNHRVMPDEHPTTAACGEQLVFDSNLVRVVCDATGPNEHATVSIRFGSAAPIVLDRHNGFFDFIHVWAKQDASLIRFTIDYGILE